MVHNIGLQDQIDDDKSLPRLSPVLVVAYFTDSFVKEGSDTGVGQKEH